MIERHVELPRRRSFFLFGPRQTGKSTLIRRRWGDGVWAVDLLRGEEFLKYAREPAQFRREAQAKLKRDRIRVIFIDEIQKVPALLDEIQALMADFPACQFIATGSSPRKLKRGAANLLAGRLVERFLFPFTRAELGGGFDLEEVLRFGSLPPVHGQPADVQRDILRAYAEVYLREEIQAEGIVRNLGGFSRFLNLAGAECGEMVSFSAVSREVSLPIRTVQSYYEILADTLIGLRLEAWRRSLRRRLVARPKFYLFDLGVTNAISRRLSDPPDAALRGRLFEQFLILETHRLLSNSLSEARLFFWRTNHGAEVDLLIERGGRLRAAVEIKAKRNVGGADLTGLRSFREENPKCPLYLVCESPNHYELDGVTILPWEEYLKRLPGLAAR